MEDKYEKYRQNPDEYNCDDNTCDLDASKICDNCGKCIETTKNFEVIKITKILTDENK